MPRWRTMIEPAETSWPSPALTPSRWPTLSRPFLELEPAFLCAIRNPYSSFLALRGARAALALSAGSSAPAAVVAVRPLGGSLRRALGRVGLAVPAEAFVALADDLSVSDSAAADLVALDFVPWISQSLPAPRWTSPSAGLPWTPARRMFRPPRSPWPASVRVPGRRRPCARPQPERRGAPSPVPVPAHRLPGRHCDRPGEYPPRATPSTPGGGPSWPDGEPWAGI